MRSSPYLLLPGYRKSTPSHARPALLVSYVTEELDRFDPLERPRSPALPPSRVFSKYSYIFSVCLAPARTLPSLCFFIAANALPNGHRLHRSRGCLLSIWIDILQRVSLDPLQ
ncbi:hypothetical protein CC2G_014653 [Coprinopsis cinerea AmutBmut pab1-1]|nr:hypothetical protein CC2G_014653 [Coprinopsis cinerea AmutBmut pab1-1]